MSASDVADALGKNLAQGRSSGFSNTFLPMLGITALAVYAWQMRSKAKMLEERNRELALELSTLKVELANAALRHKLLATPNAASPASSTASPDAK